MYSIVQKDNYQQQFSVYFLLGLGSQGEDQAIESLIQEEIKSHRLSKLYKQLVYNNIQ